MESWKPKFSKLYKPSRRSKAAINAPCKKHPKHRQSPGVCSICLTEKLSHLLSNPMDGSSSSRAKAARSPYSSTSPSSYDLSSLSSSNISSCSSPVVIYTRLHDSDARKYSMRVFKKSRSMAAFVPTRRKQEDGMKRGFWSKLFPGNRGMMHSRTMRERVITVVH